jgi:hypothetical protein
MLQFSADTYAAHENQSEATLAVERIGGSSGAVAVSYVVIGGSAQVGNDYALISGKLDFADGETRKTFGVPLRDDSEIEGDETIIMLLHAVTGGATLGTRQTAIVTIVDDETSNVGILQFREQTPAVSEDNGPARVEVERVGGSSGTVQVGCATTDGSAHAGSDYRATSETLTFADGETIQTCTIPITDDIAIEASEYLTLTLSNASGGGILGTHRAATLTIADNDTAADLFEPNNTCSAARQIPTNGTIHQLTFDQSGDEDWLTFDAVQGETYRIIVDVPPTSPANVELEIHRRCQGPAEQQQNNTFNPGIRLTITAPSTGPLFIKTSNAPSSEAGADVTYTIQIQRGAENPPGALILVAGRMKQLDPLQDNIHNVTNQVYRLFQSWGYTTDRITYLATDMTLDADGDGTADVDDTATRTNLEAAITQWALQYVDQDRPLTIYLVDHGSYDKLYLDKTLALQRIARSGEEGVVTPGEVDSWVSELEHQRPGITTRVIVESCYSGSFIDLAETVSKVGRVIISSTSSRSVAYDTTNGALFSDYFTDALSQGKGLFNSFRTARASTMTAHADQTPWIDVNGNGIPNEPEDHINEETGGIVPSEEQWPPYIASAGLAREIQQGSGEIAASVSDDSGVQFVWATIYAPSYTPPPATEAMAHSSVPTIVLLKQSAGQYNGLYTNFNEAGTYRVVVHAMDNDGLDAQPVEFTIQTQPQPALYLPLVMK